MSKTVKVLFTEKDREALQPVLEALRAKGLRVSEAAGELRKDDTVLAAAEVLLSKSGKGVVKAGKKVVSSVVRRIAK